MQNLQLSRAIQVLSFFFLLFGGLYFVKEFLVPITIAGLMATLFLPLVQTVEKRGPFRGWSSLFAVVALLLAMGLVIGLL